MRFAILAFLFLGTNLHTQEAGFHPEQQVTIIQRSADYTVRLRREGPNLRVTVDNRDQRRAGNLVLPSEVAQVDRIEFVGPKKVAIFGAVSGDVSAVVLLTLDPSNILDKFYCYAPALSPDKRFLAFIKFFPAHFAQGVSDVYLLYDFQKSPTANRPSGVSPGEVQNVGQVMYPPTSKNQSGDNVARPESEIHMLESGAFFWSPKGDRLAFVDRYQNNLWLIAAIFSDSTVKVKASRVNNSDVCRSAEIDKCNFAITSIQFANQEHLKLRLRPYNAAVPIKDEIDLDMVGVPVTTKIDLDM